MNRNNLTLLSILILMSCGEDNSNSAPFDRPENLNNVTIVPYDWNLLADQKYRYAGAAIEENEKRCLFYCANIDRPDRPIITDHIVMRTGNMSNDKWQYGEENVAIWPGEEEDVWDGLHVCDPTVVGGEFWYQGPEQSEKEKFNYALFYLGIPQGEYFPPNRDIVNQIGWAVAKSPEGPWYKVVDSSPLITSDDICHWGVGQSSAISLDEKGEVLLFYTRGESKTATYSQRLDLRDANNPVLFGESELPTTGLTQYDGSPDPLNHTGAFVYDDQSDRFYIIRNGHPYTSSCPDWISSFLQIASISSTDLEAGGGEWTVIKNLEGVDEYPPKFFDGGWVRNKYGGLPDPEKLEVLASTSSAGGACTDFWLYTYRIQGYILPKPDNG